MLHTPPSCMRLEGHVREVSINQFVLRMLFTFVLYAPKAYIHMIIKSLDENIVHETLVTKSELFRDSQYTSTVETNPGT